MRKSTKKYFSIGLIFFSDQRRWLDYRLNKKNPCEGFEPSQG